MERHTLSVAYVVSDELVRVSKGLESAIDLANHLSLPTQVSSLLPSNRNRSFLVHSLVSAFSLQSLVAPDGQKRIKFLRPRRATTKELLAYHTRDYLDYAVNPSNDHEDPSQVAEFGLEDVRFLLYYHGRIINTK